MSEHVYLVGAESVQSAGHSISHAADNIRSAANSIYESTERLIRALDGHASRIERSNEDLIEALKAVKQ